MPQHALAVVLGSLLAFYQNQLPDLLWSAFLPMLLLLGWCNARYRCIAVLSAAYLWGCSAYHYHLDHRLISAYDNQISLVQGVIADIPEIEVGRIQLYFKPQNIAQYPTTMPRLLRLNWYQSQVIPRPGEIWQFQTKLRQPRGFLNPGGFDYQAWQFTKGIDASGYIRKSTLNQRLTKAPRWNIHHWRAQLATLIEQSCSACKHLGLIKALALGFRGDITATQAKLLRDSGTAHLLAISGLHIGMVAFVFFGLGQIFWRLGFYRTGLNRIQTGSLLAVIAALGYAALAGFSLPTVRALIMFLVLFLALLFKRRIDLLQSISMAAVVILIVDPRAVGSASFWLSFGALLVIALARFKHAKSLCGWRQLLVMQLYFSLLFLPPGMYIFGQANPASLLANCVAIPLVSFVVLPLVLVASLLAVFGSPWAPGLFACVDVVLEHLIIYLNGLLSSGLQSISGAAIPGPLLMFALGSIWLVLMPLGARTRRCALVLLAILVTWKPARMQHGDYELTVLDVGMGTSIVLRTQSHSLVYDFGPGNRKGFSSADWTLLPFIRRHAITPVDLMVVSHVDQDHSGGFQSFLTSYRAARLLSGTPRELEARFSLNHSVRSCHGYPAWNWDGVSFQFLSLAESNEVSTNNRSCVLLVNGHHRALIPGDIETRQELKLVREQGDRMAAEFLVAPHHGSNTSSSEYFLRRVNPEHVVFTLSRGNRWGFPHPAVLARYTALGSRQYRSDQGGAITMLSRAGNLKLRSAAAPNQRIWRRW